MSGERVTRCPEETERDIEKWAAWFEDFFATLASLFGWVEPRLTARALCLPKTSSVQVTPHVRIHGGCRRGGRVVGCRGC